MLYKQLDKNHIDIHLNKQNLNSTINIITWQTMTSYTYSHLHKDYLNMCILTPTQWLFILIYIHLHKDYLDTHILTQGLFIHIYIHLHKDYLNIYILAYTRTVYTYTYTYTRTIYTYIHTHTRTVYASIHLHKDYLYIYILTPTQGNMRTNQSPITHLRRHYN